MVVCKTTFKLNNGKFTNSDLGGDPAGRNGVLT